MKGQTAQSDPTQPHKGSIESWRHRHAQHRFCCPAQESLDLRQHCTGLVSLLWVPPQLIAPPYPFPLQAPRTSSSKNCLRVDRRPELSWT
ncbi:hypothetical protein J4Q44_G00082520 [Coregonus suidteri]|uniref:Uncharacterized protein n=1 Tax=Coregonus suidteri TaxID=861788 RepID=A0AAN8R1T8_9TELE